MDRTAAERCLRRPRRPHPLQRAQAPRRHHPSHPPAATSPSSRTPTSTTTASPSPSSSPAPSTRPARRHACSKSTTTPSPPSSTSKAASAKPARPRIPAKSRAKNHRGDLAAAIAEATVTIDNTYITPIQNHNPMEPHATIAWWEGEKLNVYDSTQYITGDQAVPRPHLRHPARQCPRPVPLTSAAASAPRAPRGRTFLCRHGRASIVQQAREARPRARRRCSALSARAPPPSTASSSAATADGKLPPSSTTPS